MKKILDFDKFITETTIKPRPLSFKEYRKIHGGLSKISEKDWELFYNSYLKDFWDSDKKRNIKLYNNYIKLVKANRERKFVFNFSLKYCI